MDNINDKIRNALKDNTILKIMNKASKRFKNQLDKDTIKTCQLNALWKTFLNHDPTKGAKFTTYLYSGVFIECMKEIKFTQKFNSKNTGKLHNNIASPKNQFLIVDLLDELIDEEEKQIFIDRMNNMTIYEMSTKYGKNRETTRRKMHKLFKKIASKFN